jgi:hypothetical protein
MHAALADDAVQIVKQTVKRRPSFLGMNAPVRALIGLLHVALAPGMHAEHHRGHPSTAMGRGRQLVGAGSQPRRTSGLRIKNST